MYKALWSKIIHCHFSNMLLITLIATLHFNPVRGVPSDLWRIEIDNSPAPPPELGPPGAVNADRNISHLKFQIVGIIAAYLLWLLITVVLIVFFGRRLRLQTQNRIALSQTIRLQPHASSIPLSEMVATRAKGPGVDVASPRSLRFPSIHSFKKKGHKSNASELSTSTVTSAGMDEAHRLKNMDQLADLYAHVMVHDEATDRSAHLPVDLPDECHSPTSPHSESDALHYSERLSHPMAPTPVDDHFSDDVHELRASQPGISRSFKPGTPLSIISEISNIATSMVSPRRPKRISIKDQAISQPMGSANLRDAHFYSDSVPLSPRLYTPGPPPPTPGRRRQDTKSMAESIIDEEVQLQIQPSKSRERKAPPALTLRTAAYSNPAIPAGAQTASAAAHNKPLPFREAYGEHSLRSAPPTKTTFVDRPSKATATSNGPRTGTIPATPYSAYMPFTPMTPVTPRRLLNKEEIKKARKGDRLKALSEDDLVQDDENMWGKVR